MRMWLCYFIIFLQTGCAMCTLGKDKNTPFRSMDFSSISTVRPVVIWKDLLGIVSEEYEILFANREELKLETKWRTCSGRMYLKATRLKAICRVKGDNEGLIAECIVLREENANKESPLEISNAKWISIGRDSIQERRIIHRLNNKYQ